MPKKKKTKAEQPPEGEKKGTITCRYCPRSFSRRNCYRNHLIKHNDILYAERNELQVLLRETSTSPKIQPTISTNNIEFRTLFTGDELQEFFEDDLQVPFNETSTRPNEQENQPVGKTSALSKTPERKRAPLTPLFYTEQEKIQESPNVCYQIIYLDHLICIT